MTTERYAIGLKKLTEIDGGAGEEVVARLAGISPDFAKFLVESFGDVYARPQLSLREREIATIAALTALGHAQPQLKVHVNAGLNVGLSREEIIEIIMHLVLYNGFPASLNALFSAREVFDTRE